MYSYSTKNTKNTRLTRVVAHEAEGLAGDLLLVVRLSEVRPAAKVRLDAEVGKFLPVADARPALRVGV